MFIPFFLELKAAKIPVSLREFLDLLGGMKAGIAEFDVEEFYYLARTSLVKDERFLDRFDQVFAHAFRGVHAVSGTSESVDVAEIPTDWLQKLAEKHLSEDDKKLIEALGGFEEDFFCYCEDVDLGFRHRLVGGRSVQVANARVRHIGAASSSRLSEFAVYHGIRNRLWTFVRCMPAALFWFLLLPHCAATLLLWAHTAWRGAGRAYGRGLRDGLESLPRVWKQRRMIQSTRTVKLAALLRQFAWSPLSLLTRAIVLQKL